MPYKSNNDLPSSVKDNMPEHAQEVYREAFNSAYEQYDNPSQRRGNSDQEETAHKVAWSAVKKAGYNKGEDGNWHKE